MAFHFSSDGTHISYIAELDGQKFVVVDGVEQKKYQDITSITFSPDGNHWAFKASELPPSIFSSIVLDGKQLKSYEHIDSAPTFSLDNKHFAYAARSGDEGFIVLDGVEQSHYSRVQGGESFSAFINTVNFSSDSQHVAYVVYDGKEKFVVLDGSPQKKYEDIVTEPVFSPDSTRLAYAVRMGAKQFIILDGSELPQYDGPPSLNTLNTYSFAFSPDSKRFAYKATLDGKSYVMVDKIEQISHNLTWEWDANGIVFSPDSKRIFYTVEQDGKMFAVVDGRPQKEYKKISSVVFSSDSSHFAYVANSSPDRSTDENFVVFDDQEQEKFNEINGLIFSPDSKKMVYVGKFIDTKKIVKNLLDLKALSTDPAPEKLTDFIRSFGEMYSQNFVVLDGVKQKVLEGVGNINFDKSFIYYNALKGKDIWIIVNQFK